MYVDATEKRRPIGVLMIEHRTIERALDRFEAMSRGALIPADSVDVAALVDFFGTYADEVHHGKEEAILFAEVDVERLDAEMTVLLEAIKQEHVAFRAYRRQLDEANRRLAAGDGSGRDDVNRILDEFIPKLRAHITKEDELLFRALDRLQDDDTRREMMRRFRDYDAETLHRGYARVAQSAVSA